VKTSVALWITVLSVSLAASSVSAHGGASVHSENVEDAHHAPLEPVSGEAVSIHLYVRNDTRIESVIAIYCRVQHYACAPAVRLVETSPDIYDGWIAWKSDFFEGVTEVGYKFEIRYVDGSNETTPLSHFPSRPADLPPGGDTYYYYKLKPAPESPGLGPAWLLGVCLLALAWRNRR
jgi:hypothetical protein